MNSRRSTWTAISALASLALVAFGSCARRSESPPPPPPPLPPAVPAEPVPPRPPPVVRASGVDVRDVLLPDLCPTETAQMVPDTYVVCRSPLCGNGSIDARCDNRLPQAAEPTSEECDGRDLGKASCASLGFGGGKLQCRPWCSFDTSQCDPCARSPHLAACKRADVRLEAPHQGLITLALAATEREIALAWTAGEAKGPNGTAYPLSFARFRSDLSKIAESDCTGPTSLGALPQIGSLALAPTPSGWLLAAQFQTGILLLPLDAEGKPLRESGWTIAGSLVALVPQPEGPPMLLSVTAEDGLVAMLVDKAPERQPVALPNSGFVGAVFTGDAFLVATMALVPSGNVSIQGVSITHLDRELRLVGRCVAVAEESLFSASLGWSGREAILAYANGSGTRMARIGPDGTPLAPPSSVPALAPDPSFGVEPKAVVGFEGKDSLLLLSTHSSDSPKSGLQFARVTSDGRATWPASALSRDPGLYPGFFATIVPREHDAMIAWLTSGFPPSIQLARIAP